MKYKGLYYEYVTKREAKGLFCLTIGGFRRAIREGKTLEDLINSTRKKYKHKNAKALYEIYKQKETGFVLKLTAFKQLLYNEFNTIDEIINRPYGKTGRPFDTSLDRKIKGMYDSGHSFKEIAQEVNRSLPFIRTHLYL